MAAKLRQRTLPKYTKPLRAMLNVPRSFIISIALCAIQSSGQAELVYPPSYWAGLPAIILAGSAWLGGNLFIINLLAHQ
jgi:hypothetical protein